MKLSTTFQVTLYIDLLLLGRRQYAGAVQERQLEAGGKDSPMDIRAEKAVKEKSGSLRVVCSAKHPKAAKE